MAEYSSKYVGELSISGENWINPDKSYHDSNYGDPIYSISGDAAEYFEIIGGLLYFKSHPDFDFKNSQQANTSAGYVKTPGCK